MTHNVYEILCLLKAIAPITHNSGTAGNEAVLMREPVMAEGARLWVPVLSGNALRHQLREAGYLDLIARCGLAGRLSLAQWNFLLHGGSLTKSTANTDLARTHAGCSAIPLLRIFGGSLDNEILPGWLDCGRGVLICGENQRRLKALWPDATSDLADSMFDPEDGGVLRPAETFVAPYQYTRGDARKYVHPSAAESQGDSNLMIFSGEQVVTGAAFVWRLRLRSASEIHAGALLTALELWSGVMGGQRSRGHGQFDAAYRVVCGGVEIPAQPLMDAYHDHAQAQREAAAKWLRETFGGKAAAEEALV